MIRFETRGLVGLATIDRQERRNALSGELCDELRSQLEAHRAKLREYERQLQECKLLKAPRGVMLALESGIGHEREYVRFWAKLRR